jgi:predicted RNA-binding Zn-ribbon protein involved in translation (DUF1610 family)
MIAEEHRWPCAQCGADLRYAPGQTDLVCDHCGHAQTIPAAASPRKARALGELPLARGLADDLPEGASEEVRATSCPSCGAQVEFQGASHATECPFCATPVVIDTGTHRRLKPQAVLPFVLDERAARAAMVAWLGRLWFAPNGLVEYARKGRALNGIYVPFWTFDADTRTRYTGQRGENYTETRTVTVNVNGKSEQRSESVTKTRWYPARGRVARVFDDVTVMASRGLPGDLGNALEPWDLGALQPFTPDYLAGFQAEGYTLPLAEGHAQARDRMVEAIRADIRADIGGDAQRIDSMDTDWGEETFKHVLLPVWTAAYRFNGKSYTFLVNGQTGKVKGERPWSAWKIAFAVLVSLVVAGGALYLADPEALGLSRPAWMD